MVVKQPYCYGKMGQLEKKKTFAKLEMPLQVLQKKKKRFDMR